MFPSAPQNKTFYRDRDFELGGFDGFGPFRAMW
jgi:hypothetical protein